MDRAICITLITAPNAAVAETIARAVVEKQLAACVNIVPGVTSIYRWEGQLNRDDEVLLIAKTRADLFDALRAAVVALHPYDVPEVIRLDVTAGHEPYLKWVGDLSP